MGERAAGLVALGVIACAIAILIIGGVVMALAMGDHMGMMRRGGSSPQTPVVNDAQSVRVEIREYEFLPRDLTVRTGTEVTWTNFDGAPHDATADGQAWNTETLRKGDSATLTFDTAGTYGYHCSIHPSMKATLTVR